MIFWIFGGRHLLDAPGGFKRLTMGNPKRELEEVAMAGDSAQQQQEATAMLEVMIQSTHQLDEILQRMCVVEKEAATRPAAGYPRAQGPGGETPGVDKQREAWGEADGDGDGDAGFEECWETSPASMTVDEYLEYIKKAFKAAKDGNVVMASTKMDIQALQESAEAMGGDPNVRFARSTRDTAFIFPSSRSNLPVDRLDNDLTVTTPCPVAAAPPADLIVAYTQFLCRLRQELVACDHLVPVQRADALAMLAVLLLEKQHDRLLAAICSLFPRVNSQSSQDQDIHWIQGNRVCQIFVEETHQNCQWGLLLRLHVTSLLRPQTLAQGHDSQRLDLNENDSKQELMLSSCTRYTLFLPKAGYLVTSTQAGDLQVVVAITLRLHDPTQSRSDAHAETAGNGHQSPETPDIQRKDKEEGFTATNFSPPIAQLPEILNVSVWGAHDEVPSSDEANPPPLHTQTLRDGSANKFTKLRIETPFPRNRIVQAASSRFHTLFLNDMGLVFAYGHAMDGALGLGSESRGYVAQPKLVDFFFDNLVVVQHIACGGDLLVGAHSAAVSQEGHVFTWGVGIVLGNGALRSAAAPQRIKLPQVELPFTSAAATTTASVPVVQSVTCGSGFCVALTTDGHAFSWGKWSDGRLGLGRIPIIARTTRRRGGGAIRRQFQSFQLTPKQIIHVSMAQRWTGGSGEERGLEPATFLKVACGDAHCVAVTGTGELVTWGRGNSGQLGRGDASDALLPTLVFESTRKGPREEAPLQWRDVVAGDNWSMALSEDGRVWSWGACGGAVLGHGVGGTHNNALLAETILQRHQRLLAQRQKPTATAATACPALPRFKWMTPQVIPCFSTSDTRICRLSAGVQHAAAISATGDLYLWGEGYGSSGAVEGSAMLSSLPKLVNSGRRVEEVTSGEDEADIGTHSVEHVVCGGRQVVAFTSGSFLARSMHHLYHETIARRDVSQSHRTSSIADPDVVLIVSGQRLAAHKLLLARRSPVLRELILEEEQQQNQLVRNATDGESTSSSTISPSMELLLPQLRVDVARALLEFIYTDNLSPDVNPQGSSYLIRDVLRAARIYKLPSLAQLCRERLFSASPVSRFDAPIELEEGGKCAEDESFATEDRGYDDDDDEDDSIPGTGAARTLNDDMKLALTDTAWTDAILVAGSRSIPVHRCMLVARSEYFRAVFAFQNASTHDTVGVHGSGEPTFVNVEDSYDGLVRVLHFIYHDQVTLPSTKSKSEAYDGKESGDDDEEAEEASDQLLEDLLAADKYGLERMKRLCEHAVCVTVANCLEVLAVAELVHAAHLKQVAMRFVQTHLAAVTARQAEFKRFQTDFPQLLQELYTSIRDASHEEFLLREWHKAVGTTLAAQRSQQELQYNTKSAAAPFPWVPLSLALAFGTLYLSMMHAQEHEYPMVPATNIATLAAIAGAVMFGWV